MVVSKFRMVLLMLIAGIAFTSSVSAQSLPQVSGASYDGQQLTWNEVEGATGYNIHLDFDYFTTVGNTTSYTPELSGTYYVVAYNDQGQYSPIQVITDDVVPATNSVVIATVGEPAEPADPNDLPDEQTDEQTDETTDPVDGELELVTGAAYDGTTITWDAMQGATGYNVHYFFPDGTGGWQYLVTVGNVTSYVPEMTGTYNIVSYDDAGNFSPFQIVEGSTTIVTNSVTVESLGEESEPPQTGLSLVMGVAYDGELITWDAVEGATGYNIHIDQFEYLATVRDVTSFEPPLTGRYYIVAFDDMGSYGPIQIINDDGSTMTSTVEVDQL